MLDAVTFKLGTNMFSVAPLLGEESFLLQPRILPLVAELSALVGAQAESGESMTALIEKVAPIVTRACAKLPPDELKFIMRSLLKNATMDGQQLYRENPDGTTVALINVLMQGRTLDIWKLLAKALEVSYPDFFALARGFQARAAAKADPSGGSTTSDHGPAGGL